jgi:hypothetical protein
MTTTIRNVHDLLDTLVHAIQLLISLSGKRGISNNELLKSINVVLPKLILSDIAACTRLLDDKRLIGSDNIDGQLRFFEISQRKQFKQE